MSGYTHARLRAQKIRISTCSWASLTSQPIRSSEKAAPRSRTCKTTEARLSFRAAVEGGSPPKYNHGPPSPLPNGFSVLRRRCGACTAGRGTRKVPRLQHYVTLITSSSLCFLIFRVSTASTARRRGWPLSSEAQTLDFEALINDGGAGTGGGRERKEGGTLELRLFQSFAEGKAETAHRPAINNCQRRPNRCCDTQGSAD